MMRVWIELPCDWCPVLYPTGRVVMVRRHVTARMAKHLETVPLAVKCAACTLETRAIIAEGNAIKWRRQSEKIRARAPKIAP
jgi:hypothetical protein